jgi:TonB family protein
LTAFPNTRVEEAAAGLERRRPGASAPRVLIALTSDPALSRAVQELVGSGIEVGVVQTAQALIDELLQHASATALIDSATVDMPIEALVDTISGQFPDLRLLVAGHSTEQNLLATRIAKQSVFRFVHKPASAQRLKLFLDAVSRQSDAARLAAPAAQPPGRARPAVRTASAFGGGMNPRTLGIGIAVLVAIAIGLWLLLSGGGSPDAKSRGAASADKADTTGSPAGNLITGADLAFAAAKYVATDGTSAAELYRDALKADPANEIARSGFDRSIEYGLRSAEEALLANQVNAAAGVAETLRLLVPGNSRLAFLQTQIDRETARINADASQRQANEARQARIQESLDRMSDAMGRGALLDPVRNNAVLHFRAAAEVNAADPAVRNARETLVAALLTMADNELGKQRLAPASRLIDAAGSINSSAPGLDVLKRRVRELQSQAEAAATAAAAAAAVPDPAAEAVPAPATSTPATPVIVSESTLRRVNSPDPVYPQRALEQLVSGWVELQFTVARDGSVQNIEVMEASPRGTFDRAAITALKRWRYEPVMRDGETVPQRAHMRMRFTAMDRTR